MTDQPGRRDPLSILGDRASTKVRRAIDATLVGTFFWQTGRNLYSRADARLTYRIVVEASDAIYGDIHAWVLDQLPPKRRKAIIARSARRYDEVSPTAIGDPQPTAARLALYYDGTVPQRVRIDGHPIRVEYQSEHIEGNDQVGYRRQAERIMLYARGVAARDATLAWLTSIAASKIDRPVPRLFMARWGSEWIRRDELAARTIDSVVLADGQADRIVRDVERFLASESDYVRFGIPWHRGLIFEGPPGSGKTSAARAVAHHFGLDVYYVPLSDLTADTNLLNLVSAVPARSVLLLEDIDVVHAATSRDDAETAGISLSGLLNALDGFLTPHGLITIMTTNNIDVLDAALVRPGRADLIEHFGYLDGDQYARLYRMLTGTAATYRGRPGLPAADVSAAEVVNVVKPYLDDRPAAVVAISEWASRRFAGQRLTGSSTPVSTTRASGGR